MYGEEMGTLTEGRFKVFGDLDPYVIRVIRYLYTNRCVKETL